MKRVILVVCLVWLFFIVPVGVVADSQFEPGEDGTLYAQVLDGAGDPVNNATTVLSIYSSNGTVVLGSVNMTYITGTAGLYGYNFTAPSEEGSYVVEVISANPTGYGSDSMHVTSANVTAGINATDVWSENTTGYTDNTTFGGLFSNFGGRHMLFLGLIILAVSSTALAFWRRNIVFSMGSSLGWLAIGLLLLLSPSTIGMPTLAEPWVQALAYLFFLMTAGSLLWYISGIGKVKLTQTDKGTGKSWSEYSKPPKPERKSRSGEVKNRRKEALKKAKGK